MRPLDRLYNASWVNMSGVRYVPGVFAAVIVASCAFASRSIGQNAAAVTPFQAYVDMKTFMQHVLTPAATAIWRTNGIVIDEHGEHDLSPKTGADWEQIVSGAATLVEATNALMIPQRELDSQWNFYAEKLAEAADKAYVAAEAHDLKSLAEVSDRLDGVCAACHRHYGLE